MFRDDCVLSLTWQSNLRILRLFGHALVYRGVSFLLRRGGLGHIDSIYFYER